VADLALKHRLPTISDLSAFAAQGGLMSYSYKPGDVARSAAEIVDKILRGAKAGEIPIQQAATFQLVINLKTRRRSV
jgi:putative ABC transport system substrate-binding protein